jgi:hypothetical protein
MTELFIAILFGFAVGGMFRNSMYDGSRARSMGRVLRNPVMWIFLFLIGSIIVHAHQ